MRHVRCWIFGLGLHILFFTHASTCVIDSDCGWSSSTCENATCICDQGFVLHSNGKDCRNSSCGTTEDCLQCTSSSHCIHCVNFLEESTRVCLTSCTGEAKLLYTGVLQGNICKLAEEEVDNSDVIIGVIAGVSAGLLLCIVILIAYCIYIRRTRRNVNLNRTHYDSNKLQAGNISKVPIYDNKGFDTDNEPSLVHNVIDREVYLNEIDKLKPHAHTLLQMLNEIRHKLRAMDKSDPRVPTYKGVIHQLCRVLVLIHKKDPRSSIPADALGLFEWAQQMLEDRLVEVEPAEDSIETNRVTKISYVEVPETQSNPYATPVIKKPANPYATLNKRHSRLNMSSVSNQSNLTNGSFYSSVPVPVGINPDSHINHVSVSQNNTLNKVKTEEALKRQYEIPWDLKMKSDSLTTLDCSGSDLTMGYFANGRFYDPTPRQLSTKHVKQSEIYAPASSYSDRSNQHRLSTFTGGIPRNPSVASSHPSTVSNPSEAPNPNPQEEDEEEVDQEEAFPFDMKDATEPVEV